MVELPELEQSQEDYCYKCVHWFETGKMDACNGYPLLIGTCTKDKIEVLESDYCNSFVFDIKGN